MEYRPLEITIVSAKDLKDVNVFSKMETYAVVSLGSDPRTAQRTRTDKEGGKSPTWNFPVKFSVDEAAAQQNRLSLRVLIRAERSLGDRDVGEVHVPVKELLDSPGDGKAPQFVSYQVRRSSGRSKGVLNFSYKFGEKITAPLAEPPSFAPPVSKSDEPVMAYPPGSSSGYQYPPPPHGGGYPPAAAAPAGYSYVPPPPGYGYGYPPPPQHGYGYPPPPQHGYGYPGQVVQPQGAPRKNKLGMGLGAGLLGGALGGLLIGDMISDATSYDAGYDAGFDDGGGFDF
ncbi:hypothetical protein H6P81_015101 [Aristolochia fimbriata]|uniref:C2 domain-containing protein n=1 Tax=Aristolochia fimbriata TaxID=158543 RepID=A0AAV7E7F8_ARIFI|nr:hypothetical protein H6P81_015101 [Aristolochia fimbriata]